MGNVFCQKKVASYLFEISPSSFEYKTDKMQLFLFLLLCCIFIRHRYCTIIKSSKGVCNSSEGLVWVVTYPVAFENCGSAFITFIYIWSNLCIQIKKEKAIWICQICKRQVITRPSGRQSMPLFIAFGTAAGRIFIDVLTREKTKFFSIFFLTTTIFLYPIICCDWREKEFLKAPSTEEWS
jgi:hypothetical protein